MIYGKAPVTCTIAQVGNLNRTAADRAIGIANQVQRAFHFKLHHQPLPLNKTKYKLPNSGFDLEKALMELVKKRRDLPRPLTFLTSLPYGDRQNSKERNGFYSFGHRFPFDSELTLLSTYTWENILGEKRLQPYILYGLTLSVLSLQAGLEFHEEVRSCLFDRGSSNFENIKLIFKGAGLCNSCETYLNSKLRNGEVTVEQAASAKKLFNRACGRKTCFIVMPFDRALKPVYEVVGNALREEGWAVIRADEIVRPRRITDAILQATLMSDLVVADLTKGNPNVFYELGLAHAIGCDVILLTQERRIPFDVAPEATIFYKSDKRGFHALDTKLRAMVGKGSA
jgi:hypothetical protein